MNIKQAPCMARIVAPGHPESGWIVRVMRAAPYGRFYLPDGYPGTRFNGAASWVCESLMHSSFKAPLSKSGRNTRLTRFVVIADVYLRPLPGVDVPEQSQTSTPSVLETV